MTLPQVHRGPQGLYDPLAFYALIRFLKMAMLIMAWLAAESSALWRLILIKLIGAFQKKNADYKRKRKLCRYQCKLLNFLTSSILLESQASFSIADL